MTPRVFANLDDAEIIETTAFALTQRAVEALVERQAMGVVHGKAGLGKTFAVEYAIESRGACESYWFDFPERVTSKWLTRDLLELLTDVPTDGEHRKLRKELIEVLAERPRLLVVDEAQRLTRASVEYLRHLHDHRRTRFSLLLVGGNGCWETLSRHAMLRSRIWRRVEFTTLSTAEVVEIMPRYHRLYSEASPELLAFVDDYFGHGNFRNWTGFTASASDLCDEHGLSTLTEDVARAIFALQGGGVGAT